MNKKVIFLIGFITLFSSAFSQTFKSYKLAELNWMENKKIIPSEISTVLIAAGTVEAHGVTSNNTDIIIPDVIAERIAPSIPALVAPAIPYGATRSINYPGGIPISDQTLESLYYEIFTGLIDNKFKNIIVLNGHGPNRPLLEKASEKLYLTRKCRILIIDWWSYTEDISKKVYNNRGGHAGSNETGAVLAINPSLVKKELFSIDLASVSNKTYSAYPSESSLILYDEGKGYPDFDEKKAKTFFEEVCNSIQKLIKHTISKWDKIDQ